jgi:hypothetical protein
MAAEAEDDQLVPEVTLETAETQTVAYIPAEMAD